MANMSYCRFQNTRGDLADCLDALEEGDVLSGEECEAGKWMFKSFLMFCRERDIIDDFRAEDIDEMFEAVNWDKGEQ